MKKGILVLICISLLLSAFAGCSGEQSTAPSTAPTQAPTGNIPRPWEDATESSEERGDDYYYQLAVGAVDDLIKNWWSDDLNRVLPTWEGYPKANLPDERGATWEAAMLIYNLYNMWVLTGDDYYKQFLEAEAEFYHTAFTEEEMETAAGNMNWASDDCAWNCLLYLCLYNVTGDMWFVDRAAGLLDSVVERWYDPELNGIFYRDNVDCMSLYEVGLCLSWLRIWEITGEQRYYDLAFRSYNGMQDRLSTDEGIYFCEASKFWPLGNKGAIGEGGSTSFLTGNMGMAALSAFFYRLTGEQAYLDNVYLTNQGILKYYNDEGVLLNDRDAWTNGTFCAIYVSEVLSLPDTDEMKQMIYSTAESICLYDRTQDGYYGGTWKGPAEGPQSIWDTGGSTAYQSMTTGTSVQMVVAAALLEAGVTDFR